MNATQPTARQGEADDTQATPEEHALRRQIMAHRGASYPEPLDPRAMLDPRELKDGLKAADRLANALLYNQTIVGVADFDCDGCCGAAVMVRGLQMLAKAMGCHPRIEIVIPDRFYYGYGLSPALADDKLAPTFPDVVVTIDNGISSVEAIAQMNQWKSAPATIVTDHHEAGDTLPPAYAIVNPNQPGCTYGSKALCGAGVIFNVLLLVRTLLGRKASAEQRQALKDAPFQRLSELVAIATVGDVVPLDFNNRLLVRHGLAHINKGWKMKAKDAHNRGHLSFGVRRLLELAGVEGPVTAMDLAFKVVPQINGVGRLEKPRAGLACLLADNRIMANMEAEHCHNANQERKTVQAGMEESADAWMAQLEATGVLPADSHPASVVLHDDQWHPGLVGLVASRIKDKTEGSVICFAPDGDPAEGGPLSDTLKGSGRSANVHLRDTLALVATWAPELAMTFGGHARAAGLSLARADLPRFRALFDQAVAHQLQVAPLADCQWHDGYLAPEQRTLSLAYWLERQPWGQHFPEPVFSGRFVVDHALVMRGRHLKLRVRDITADGHAVSAPLELVWFFRVNTGESSPFQKGDTVELDYSLGINRWNNRLKLQGVVKGVTQAHATATHEPAQPVVAQTPASHADTQAPAPSPSTPSQPEPSTDPAPPAENRTSTPAATNDPAPGANSAMWAPRPGGAYGHGG